MLQAQIYIDKDDMKGDLPLYEFILNLLLEKGIAGATAFEGIAGFGRHQKMKNPGRGFSFDETPLMIVFADEKEKVREVLTELRTKYNGGFIITCAVEQW